MQQKQGHGAGKESGKKCSCLGVWLITGAN